MPVESQTQYPNACSEGNPGPARFGGVSDTKGHWVLGRGIGGGGEAAGMHKGKAIQRGIEAMLGEGLALVEVEIDSGSKINF